MKKNKVIGALLLILAISTIIGMRIENTTFWLSYNYATIALSVICGSILLFNKK